MKKVFTHNTVLKILCFLSVILIAATGLSSSAQPLALVSAGICLPEGLPALSEYCFGMPQTSESAAPVQSNTVLQNVPDNSAFALDDNFTQTPDDIKKLIEKYSEKFANDKRDADIVTKTYINDAATNIYKNIAVRNTTETKKLDIEKVLSQPLDLNITDASQPTVLIFHTHTSEGYELIDRPWYAQGYTDRSNNEAINVVRVGTEIAEYLTAAGIGVIHDKTIYDDTYSGSYGKSRAGVEKNLEKYPSIQIVLDIHRDAIQLNNGNKLKPVTEINGKKAAQVMIITGAEEGDVTDFPDWEFNLRFALELQKTCQTLFPTLMRPVLFAQRKYNMDMAHCNLLLEMGSAANTLEEAVYSGRMIGASLVEIVKNHSDKTNGE